jgi:hypothetical protein
VFAHSTDSVSLSHCWNTGIFECTLSQLLLSAAALRLDDNKLGVAHGSVLYAFTDNWAEREIRSKAMF